MPVVSQKRETELFKSTDLMGSLQFSERGGTMSPKESFSPTPADTKERSFLSSIQSCFNEYCFKVPQNKGREGGQQGVSRSDC